MKKQLAILLAGSMLLSLACAGCSQDTTPTASPAASPAASPTAPAVEASAPAAETGTFKAGSYTATTQGMQGAFEVTVSFSENAIESISVGENSETAGVGKAALEIMTERILSNQSLGVDTATGATVSSAALLRAVSDCAKQAGADVSALRQVPSTVDTYADARHESDILVIGAGIAGTSAAISAAENGGDVILLEADDMIGGSSVFASGLYNIGATSVQKEYGIQDTPDAFYDWLVSRGKSPVQARVMADNSQVAVDFLTKLGVSFGEPTVASGSEVARSHRVSGGMSGVFAKLQERIKELNVDVRLGVKAVGFVVENGVLTGVDTVDRNGEHTVYSANKIVMACGGFANNSDLIAESWGEEYRGLIFGGDKNLDGTMLLAARDTLDAALVSMDNVRTDAMHEVTTGFNILSSLVVQAGGVMIRSSDGARFFDEVGNNGGKIKNELFDSKEACYLVFSANSMNISDSVTGKLQGYLNNGALRTYETLGDMAAALKLPEDALQAMVDGCNTAAAGGQADEFGREASTFFGGLKAPYYVMKVASGVGTVHGGVDVNEQQQVLDNSGNVIEHLYAVGECVGGYLVGYVGGDSLARGTVTGVLLGQRLASGN